MTHVTQLGLDLLVQLVDTISEADGMAKGMEGEERILGFVTDFTKLH